MFNIFSISTTTRVAYLLSFVSIFLATSLAGQNNVLPFRAEQKWGFINDTGQVILPPQFDAIAERSISLHSVTYDYFLVEQGAKLGIVNDRGEILMPPSQDYELEILSTEPFVLVTRSDSGMVAVGADGLRITPTFDSICVMDDYFFAVKKQERWGVYRRGTGLVLPTQYDYIGLEIIFDQENHPYFQYKTDINSKYAGIGLVNALGESILPTKYNRIKAMGKLGLVAYEANGIGHLFDFEGNSIQNISGRAFHSFNERLLRVKELDAEDTYILYDLSQRKCITPSKKFSLIVAFGASRNYFITRANNNYGLIDSTGRAILSNQYTNRPSYYGDHSELFKINQNGLEGLVKEGDTVVLAPFYHHINELDENGFAIIRQGQFKGLMNRSGKVVLKAAYERIEREAGGYKAFIDRRMEEYAPTSNNDLQLVRDLKNVFTIRAGYGYQRSTNTNFSRVSSRSNRNWRLAPDSPTRNNLVIFQDKASALQGLKDATTGAIVVPAIYIIKRPAHTNLSILITPPQNGTIHFENICPTELKNIAIIFLETERCTIHKDIVGIRISDFNSSNYAGFIRGDGTFGMLSKDGKLLQSPNGKPLIATFVDAYTKNLLRIYVGGQLQPVPSRVVAPNSLESWKDIISPFGLYNGGYSSISTNYFEVSGGKWAYLDTLGRFVTDCVYSQALNFNEDNFGICEGESGFGIFSPSLDTILPFQYSKIKKSFGNNGGENYYSIQSNNIQPVYLNAKGSKIDTLQGYLSIGDFYDGRAKVKKGNQLGFINKNYGIVIPCDLRYAKDFHEGYSVIIKNKQWHIMDTSGAIIVSLHNKVRLVGDIHDGMAWFQVADNYGYLSLDNPVAIKPIFSAASDFANGVAAVAVDGVYGLIGLDGEFILKPSLRNIQPMSKHGITAYQRQHSPLWGLMDENGQLLTNCIYDYVGAFKQGYAKVRRGYKYGMIDSTGQLAIPIIYGSINEISDGMLRVKTSLGAWQYIDMSTLRPIRGKYEDSQDFKDGLAVVWVADREHYSVKKSYAVINKKGERIYTSSKAQKIIHFAEGIRTIQKTELIRRTQEYIVTYYFLNALNQRIGIEYQEATPFENGLAIVKTRTGYGVINQRGLYVIEPKYRKIIRQGSQFFKAIATTNYGYLTLEGNLLLDANYDALESISNSMFRVAKDDRVGYFDLNNGWIQAVD